MRLGRLRLFESDEQCIFLDNQTAVLIKDLVPNFGDSYLTINLVESLRLANLTVLPQVKIKLSETLSPIRTPRKIICVGLNYQKHAFEMGIDTPSEPIVFMKSPNSMVGGFGNIIIPLNSNKTDYVVELAVIVGKNALYLKSPQEALVCVLGYSISQDVSEHEWQLEKGGQWMKGKSFPTFNPIGPCIVTKDELKGDNLIIWSKVNGTVRQESNTSDLIFDIGYCIWYISQFMELEPGDVINTGTPEGVGMSFNPQAFLEPGDILESGIEGIGIIRNLVC